MNTVEKKNAAGVRTMVLLADENGVALEFTNKSEAALIAAKIEGASISKDAMRGRSAAEAKKMNLYGRTKKWAAEPFFYFVRIN